LAAGGAVEIQCSGLGLSVFRFVAGEDVDNAHDVCALFGEGDEVGGVFVGGGEGVGVDAFAGELDETFELGLHALHFHAHVEDDFYTGEVDAEVLMEPDDALEFFDVGLGVEAGIL